MKATSSIVILGAGPAGLSAALWLRHMTVDVCVLEAAARAGGLQNLNFLGNDWVLGQSRETGPGLARKFVDHAALAGVTVRTGALAKRVTGHAGDFRVQLDDGTALGCAALVIATGTRYRAEEVLAEVDGLRNIAPGRIAYGPYAFADLDALAGRRILIVGGGDNAFENARLLTARAAQVSVVMRADPQAQPGLIAAASGCHVLPHARIAALAERTGGLEVVLGSGEHIVVDRVHVLAGYEPNTAFIGQVFARELHGALRFDAKGYLLVDAAGRTGAAGIYAAGDVCNPRFPSVASAIGQGAVVAKAIERDLRP
ncbi:MAG TPA: NAD(P)/FAD-dependent oxidoreductase [Rhodocyclaceae bacterium]|nr:NAD(P)/FAD-dependent oxidoreductase [Rhodocyclaceae bacterium]